MKPTILRSGRTPFFSVELLEPRIAPATISVKNLNNDGPDSLRAAILEANGTPGADTILFKAGLTGTIALTTGDIDITNPLTIKGPGANKIILSGSGLSRVFNINDGNSGKSSAVSLSGLAFVNGNANAERGGAIISNESLSVTNCLFADNRGTAGGAIYLDGGELVKASVTGSVVSGNAATNGWAGGLYLDAGGGVTVTKTVVTGNTSTAPGGAAYLSLNSTSNTKAKITVTGSVFVGNSSSGSGTGGVWIDIDGRTAVVTASVFSGNTSTGTAGGLYLDGGTVMITGSTFSNNTSKTAGGAMLNDVKGTISGSKFLNNTATTGDGAGIVVTPASNGVLTITGSTFSGNSAASKGGGIFSDGGSGTLVLSKNTITGNRAVSDGGGIYVEAGLKALKLTGGIVAENSSGGTVGGGGLALAGNVDLTILASKFVGNTALGGGGGGIIIDGGGSISISSTLFAQNRAITGGGISGVTTGTVVLSGLTIKENMALSGGGFSFTSNGPSLTLAKSLITGNFANNFGGGGQAGGSVTISKSKITGNVANSAGGGVYVLGPITISPDSNVTGNYAPSGANIG